MTGEQVEVRRLEVEWQHETDAGARADRNGERYKWRAAEHFAKAHELGASWRQIGERAQLSHTYVRLMVKALETRVSTPEITFADAYARVRSGRAEDDAEVRPATLTEMFYAVLGAPKGERDELFRALSQAAEAKKTELERVHRGIVVEIANAEDLEMALLYLRDQYAIPGYGDMMVIAHELGELGYEATQVRRLAEARIVELEGGAA